MKPFITFPEFLCLVLSMKAVYIHAPSVCFMRIVGKGVGVEECVPTSESPEDGCYLLVLSYQVSRLVSFKSCNKLERTLIWKL